MSEEKPQVGNTEPQNWDVQELEAALAHLGHLQHQLDALRPTLTSIVSPLVRPATSKAQIFADVKKNAIGSLNDVKALSTNWESERTREVLERARESAKADGDVGRAEEVARYGWDEQ